MAELNLVLQQNRKETSKFIATALAINSKTKPTKITDYHQPRDPTTHKKTGTPVKPTTNLTFRSDFSAALAKDPSTSTLQAWNTKHKYCVFHPDMKHPFLLCNKVKEICERVGCVDTLYYQTRKIAGLTRKHPPTGAPAPANDTNNHSIMDSVVQASSKMVNLMETLTERPAPTPTPTPPSNIPVSSNSTVNPDIEQEDNHNIDVVSIAGDNADVSVISNNTAINNYLPPSSPPCLDIVVYKPIDQNCNLPSLYYLSRKEVN